MLHLFLAVEEEEEEEKHENVDFTKINQEKRGENRK
jgi:hypothetical protein